MDAIFFEYKISKLKLQNKINFLIKFLLISIGIKQIFIQSFV